MFDIIGTVREFHSAMGAPMSPKPMLLAGDRSAAGSLAKRVKDLAITIMAEAAANDVLLRRAAMALEELAEWLFAHVDEDLVAGADAWADRAYVCALRSILPQHASDMRFGTMGRAKRASEPPPRTPP